MFFGIVLIAIAAVAIYSMVKSGEADSSERVHAEVPGIINFLHCVYSLCNKHTVDSSDVQISWRSNDQGCDIIAYIKIYKIDGTDASESVDELRKTISQAKNEIEVRCKDAGAGELYELKSNAAQELILNYFGTDQMQGVFWDIDDCEYADGKYLEFEAEGRVYNAFNQSRDKTLDFICAKVAENYPKFRVNRGGNEMVISFG